MLMLITITWKYVIYLVTSFSMQLKGTLLCMSVYIVYNLPFEVKTSYCNVSLYTREILLLINNK